MLHSYWIGGPLAAFLLFSAIAAEAKALPEKIEKIMQQEKYQHASWGILVKDAETKAVLYEKNSNQFFLPGSTTKIFSVAALLKAYGDDYRFETPVYALGNIQDGVLKGSLVLVAQGDLTMGGRQDRGSDAIAFSKFDHIYANDLPEVVLTTQDPLNALNALAKEVKEKGIARIEGDVLIDDRLFETIELRGMILSPIMINENLIDLVIHPTTAGKPAEISWRPDVDGYTVVNACKTVSKAGLLQITIDSDESGKNVRVQGSIPEDQKEVVRTFSIKNPREFARDAFVQCLRVQGIAVNLDRKKLFPLPSASSYAGMQPVAVWSSPPLYNYAKLILKVSHNLGADLVPLLLAVKKGERTFAEGMLELGKFTTEDVKVSSDAFVFIDGAGGDMNRLTPQAEVQLLEYVRSWPKAQFQRFYDALPVLGVDGSLEDFGKGSAAAGKVCAKTGTGVSFNLAADQFFLTAQALSGFIEGKNGRLLEFMIAVNNATMPAVADIFPIFEDQAQMTVEFYNLSK